MRRFPIAAVLIAAAFTAVAATPEKPARLGLCAACHGSDGMATMAGAPNLAGQRLDYLRAALAQYRDGRRDVAVMRAAVGPLNDAEIDQLARWFAAQPPRPQASP
ncbi:MAG TPA: c-type cytochrome [Luteibacter sp.]|jgi:cytochrome c553|nr:c-type cytochrome [Luteibacter sp.]